MSITAAIVQNLLDANMGGEEILSVAKAMERGSDRDFIFVLADNLAAADCPSGAMGVAIYEVATKINAMAAAGFYRQDRFRDAHTPRRDSNKARRGLSNQRWQALRAATFERDGWECVYCGADDDLTCDHIVPLVRGGSNENENLTTACRSCNSSKGDKLLAEWRATQ